MKNNVWVELKTVKYESLLNFENKMFLSYEKVK